jgi:hypothetical protein
MTNPDVSRSAPQSSRTWAGGVVCAILGTLLIALFAPGTTLHKRIASHSPDVQLAGAVTKTGVLVRCHTGGGAADANSPNCSAVRVKVATSSDHNRISVGATLDIATKKSYAVGDRFQSSVPTTNAQNVMDGLTGAGGCLILAGVALVGVWLYQARRRGSAARAAGSRAANRGRGE